MKNVAKEEIRSQKYAIPKHVDQSIAHSMAITEFVMDLTDAVSITSKNALIQRCLNFILNII